MKSAPLYSGITPRSSSASTSLSEGDRLSGSVNRHWPNEPLFCSAARQAPSARRGSNTRYPADDPRAVGDAEVKSEDVFNFQDRITREIRPDGLSKPA